MAKSGLFAIGGFATGIAALPLAVVVTSFAAPSNSDIALIVGVIDLVQRSYVHAIGPDQLTKDALKGMLSRLDPHSDYMDEKEFRQTSGDISGKFGGLGIEISEQDGIPKVIAPIDDTPAAKAGLRSLAQSAAREYGPHGVHVAHIVIDGGIDGEQLRTVPHLATPPESSPAGRPVAARRSDCCCRRQRHWGYDH